MHRDPDQTPDTPELSAAAIWPPLRPFISGERRVGRLKAQRRWTAWLYEFLRFGLKQGWACLFGGIAVALMIATWRYYPADAVVPRYDFLLLCMIAVQAALLAGRLETSDEAKIILIYHVVGTAMEVFKTSMGSWIYPEASFFRIGGVPLFTGFMYSCIGSYLCRAWRLFDFRFSNHPRRRSLIVLSIAAYLNFFTHHFIVDPRWLLFAASAWLFGRTTIHFRVWHEPRTMPMLLSLLLVSVFIWLSENIGTFTKIWLYPSQRHGWSMVSIDKLGSWFLLLIISYTLVSLINAPRAMNTARSSTGSRPAGAAATTSA
ncbi:DUF817 domain-containing protein [Bradyrhizobium sp. JYMT SZCCT0428]|uniref:DUF817 domain-containing protein n=1 Tax=Bradyrhizobium sp. JYMT SZCCT0428 TaxID=2807673 RepID=UPI001BA45CF0|nr:DUF817 domain-containing protein [Bradyrhizobium sp. JYMT SZCCT0428]MBR1150559.1 DUF817 domain-containing protein [Bradyrhizobium sp. JYMT SZCCT0428]